MLQGGKRRTIVPAKVASLEVNPLFQLPEPGQRTQQAQQGPETQGQLHGAPPQDNPLSPQHLAARRVRRVSAEPLSPPLLPAASPAAPATAGQHAEQQPHLQQPQQAQQQLTQQRMPEQSQKSQPQHAQHLQPLSCADMTLPMSPPPVAVRLPAPGAALAASLLLRGGGGAGGGPPGSPGVGVGGGGGESASSTPTRRITPIRLHNPAEVQPTFLAAAAATSPRAARRDMLAQPEMQQSRSRPGSRLGTPLAGAAATAFGREGPAQPAATPATASQLGGGPGGSGSRGSGSGSGSSALGARSSSGRSPLLWAAEEPSSVCQQLSFDSLLSPVKAGAAAEAAVVHAATRPPGQIAAPSEAVVGSQQKKAALAVELLAHSGLCLPATAVQQSGPSWRQLAVNGSAGQTAGSGGAERSAIDSSAAVEPSAHSSRQMRILEAAMSRMTPPGGSSSAGFDEPRRDSSSTGGDRKVNPSCQSALGAEHAVARAAPVQRQPPKPAQQQQQHQAQLAGAAPQAAAQETTATEAQEAAGDAAGDQPRLCPEARRLAELHAALLRRCSGISLAGEQ